VNGGRKWLVLAALAPGMFLSLADATVMTIAIPEIIQRLDSSVTAVSWILNGYNLVLTVLFMTMGRLADRFGHKGLFLIGVAVFSLASLGCALSPTVAWIIVFRTFQAMGAAAIIPTSLTLLLHAFPARQQGLAAGLFGAISSLSASLGPTLGGLLIRAGGWEWIFYFNLPVGAFALAFVAIVVPRRVHDEPVRMDWPGVALLSGGLFCLTYGLMEGNNWGWLTAPVLALFAGAVLGLGLFVWWELRARLPLFDLRLFRRRPFAGATFAMTTVDIAMMGTAFMLVIFLVALGDYTELRAALAITFVPAAGLVIAPFAGRLIDRFGPRWLGILGSLVTGAGLIALAYMERDPAFGDVVWRTLLVGAGLGVTIPALTAAGMTALPQCDKGVGSGLLNTARQLGFLLGVAILVAVFSATVHTAVIDSIAQARVLIDRQTKLSDEWRAYLDLAMEEAEDIDATAGIGEIRRLVHPVEGVPVPAVGSDDALALATLTVQLEDVFLKEVAEAFWWPFMTAAIAALLSAGPCALLQRRLHHEPGDPGAHAADASGARPPPSDGPDLAGGSGPPASEASPTSSVKETR